MYTISKEFHFSSSHQLDHLPSDHPCSRVHGHNFTVIVEFETVQLNNDYFVIDYRKLSPIKNWIDDVLDHRHLNDLFHFPITSENLAKFLFLKFTQMMQHETNAKIKSVSLKETDKTLAKYDLGLEADIWKVGGYAFDTCRKDVDHEATD